MDHDQRGGDPRGTGGGDAAASETAFLRALVATGRAAEVDSEGRLPPQATHEIVGWRPDGLPIVERRKMTGG